MVMAGSWSDLSLDAWGRSGSFCFPLFPVAPQIFSRFFRFSADSGVRNADFSAVS